MTLGDTDDRDSRLSVGRPSMLGPPPEPGFWQRTLQNVHGMLGHLGQISRMAVLTVRAGFKRPFEGKAIKSR